MKQDLLNNKPFLIAIILVLFVILIILTIIAFTPTKTSLMENIVPTPKLIPSLTQEPNRLCMPFIKNLVKISCLKAINTALADTPGKVVSIAIGPVQLNPAIIRALERQKMTILKTQVWLIDIALNKPLRFSNGKQVKSELIEIPVDGTKAIYRIPINS